MTLQDYEVRFLDELIDNYQGGGWSEFVKRCHESYLESIEEIIINNWENQR